MKRLIIITLLLPLQAWAATLLSADYLVFPELAVNEGASTVRSVTVSNTGASAINFSAGAFSFGSGVGYSVVSDSCASVAVNGGEKCTVSFQFDPSEKGQRVAVYGWTVDGTPHSVFMSNRLEENTLSQAQRRIPPVLEKIQIFAVDSGGTEHLLDGVNNLTVDSNTIPGNRLIQGQSYRIKWFAATYDGGSETIMAFFDCGNTADNSCAGSWSGRFTNSSIAAGTALTEAQATTLGLPTYSFGGQTATHLAYQHDFNVDSLTLTNTHYIAMRFYQRGATDAAISSNTVSLMIPGGLDLLAQGDAAYIGTAGRKIVVPAAVN